MKSLSLALGAVLAAASVATAHAQADPQIFSDAVVSAGLNATMVGALNAQAKRDAANLRRGRLPAVSPSAARTRFTPSLARRKAQASKFMAAAKRINTDLAQSLAPAFREDPVRYVAPYLAKYGVRMDDVADLTAVYLVSSWYGTHGKTGNPARGEITAVRDQIRRVYAASPKLRNASNATKQDMAEGSLYLALLNDALVSVMKAHPESKARLMAEIAGGAKATFGLDLRTVRITKAGLTG